MSGLKPGPISGARARARAIDQSLRPSGFTPAFGRAVFLMLRVMKPEAEASGYPNTGGGESSDESKCRSRFLRDDSQKSKSRSKSRSKCRSTSRSRSRSLRDDNQKSKCRSKCRSNYSGPSLRSRMTGFVGEVKMGARFAREKQVPRFARNDSKKGKVKKRRSRSLRDDSQKGKDKRRSRFPEGMTARKAKATATANANTGGSPLRCASVEMTELYGATSWASGRRRGACRLLLS